MLTDSGLVSVLSDMAVAWKVVEQYRGYLDFAEHNRPFGNTQVCRDNHTGVLVELRGQAKQLMGPRSG